MRIEPAQWVAVQDQWKEQIGEDGFASWLAPLTLSSSSPSSSDTISLTVPTQFMRDWVAKHYTDVVRQGLTTVLQQDVNIEFIVDAALDPTVDAAEQTISAPVATPSTDDLIDSIPAEGSPARLSTPLDTRFTFDNFVAGKSNELALAAAQRIAESDEILYNPFFLHGRVGLGKTHLMHAIAHHLHTNKPNRKVLYISAEKFLFGFIKALRDKTTLAFKDSFRDVDVLMIDDIQFIAGKEATQEEFFHTFNALVDMRKQVILTADRSPHELPGIEDRLRSRLGSGLTVQVHQPDTETRLNILTKKAESLGMQINRDVAMLLADRINSNVRELEGALNRLAAHADLVGAAITPEFAQEQLKDIFRSYERMVTLDEIQRKVAEFYRLKLADLHGVRRNRAVVRPRQIAMYLAKQLTTRSFPEIGRSFGGRDHTTVIHAVRTIESLIESDPAIREDVDLLEKMLTSN